jgi:putative flippase GtrA
MSAVAAAVAVGTQGVAVAVDTRVAAVAVGTRVAAEEPTGSVGTGGASVSGPDASQPAGIAREWIRFGRSSFRAVVDRVLKSWAARSLQVGALATVVDVCVLLVCKKVLKLPTPVGAAIGVAIGSTVAFFLNRSFAFRAQGTPVTGQAVKFIISTLIAMSIHAPLVGILADWLDVPVVVAKLGADVLVFSVGQLLVLRFLVFRKSPSAQA